MDFIIVFFRDTLSGVWYFLYLALCIFIIFYLLGVIGDRKRLAISVKLKEKKKYDIESGREAAIAAKQTKQIIGVLEEEEIKQAVPNPNEEVNVQENQEEPAVMVLNSDSVAPDNSKPAVTPVVIDSSSIKND